jgi:hypothetical protein
MIAKLSIDQAYSDDAKRNGHHHIINKELRALRALVSSLGRGM